jgi:hypothetical protein
VGLGGLHRVDAGSVDIEELFMTKEEALDKALYALEIEDVACRYMKDETPSQIVEAITAIKQARALDKMAENARELGLDYEPVTTLFGSLPVYDTTPPAAFVQETVAWVLLREDEDGFEPIQFYGGKEKPETAAGELKPRFTLRPVCFADTTPPKQPTPVPTSWMEMVTANLVREGVNKHRARELAEHFYNLKENT